MKLPPKNVAPSTGAALLWGALLRHRRGAVLGVSAGLLWSLTRLASPVFVRRGIDLGIRAANVGELGQAVLAILALGCLGAALAGFRRYWALASAARIEADLRSRLFRHLLRLDLGFHARWPAGQLVARAASDLQQIQQPFGGLPITVSNAVIFTGVTAALIHVDPLLALVALGPTVFIFVLARLFTSALGACARQLQQAIAFLSGTIEDAIAGIRAIKGLGLEPVERERVDGPTENVYAAALRMNRVRAFYLPLIDFLPAAALVAVVWLGGRRVVEGRLTLGALVQFYSYVVLLVGPLRMMGTTVAQFERALVSADLLAALLSTPPANAEGASSEFLPVEPPTPAEPASALQFPTRGEIRFESVDFGFEGKGLLFQGLDVHIRPGETVAVVGPTGAGKSTLIGLLARLHEVHRGRVTLDGVDVRRWPLRDLRAQLGIVFEDPFLFAGSVRENIAFGATRVSQRDVERAARAAGAHEFVLALEGGYDAPVGERGLRLSGGQRQRIALARALVLEPRILVLDAATTAIDATTEESIRHALATFLRARTTLLIASSPATLSLADRVLLLEGGRVSDSGTHGALMARSALYRSILTLGLDPPANAEPPPRDALERRSA